MKRTVSYAWRGLRIILRALRILGRAKFSISSAAVMTCFIDAALMIGLRKRALVLCVKNTWRLIKS